MNTYLGYFDILGFKEFIQNNDEETVDRYFEFLFRDSQSSLVKRRFVPSDNGGLVPDIESSKVNCLHVSDSIIFWTNDITEESFEEMFNVCTTFFQCCCVLKTFPVRGCMVKGSITYDPFKIKSIHNASFSNNSLYGLALIDAYQKAESQDWVGCYIDKSALNSVDPKLIETLIQQKLLIKYNVPFKNSINREEYAIKLYGETLNNIKSKDIEELFTQHINGNPLSEKVRQKLVNTQNYFNYTKGLDTE